MSKFNIQIPESEQDDFKVLISREDDTLEKISDYLHSIDSEIEFDGFEEKIKSLTPKYKVIVGLIFTFCKVDIPAEQFINEIYEFFHKKISDDSIDKEYFLAKISKIIYDQVPIKNDIKSGYLLTENQRVFYDSRIITDIRPIFQNKENVELIGQTLVNQLKIVYKENSKTKEFYISLDEDDLLNLKKSIERAENKIKVLSTKNIYK